MLVRSGGHCGAVWLMACALSDAAAMYRLYRICLDVR